MAIGTSAFSQEVLSSAGNSVIGAGVNVSYTVGELVINKTAGAGVSLENGFHHADVLLVTADESYWSSSEVEVFPNPVQDVLTIESELVDLKFRLVSVEGTIISKGDFMESNQLNLEGFNSGIYILQLFNNQQQKSIQITKK